MGTARWPEPNDRKDLWVPAMGPAGSMLELTDEQGNRLSSRGNFHTVILKGTDSPGRPSFSLNLEPNEFRRNRDLGHSLHEPRMAESARTAYVA